MEERQAGITALITAYARAYHATHDSPKIFDDCLADRLYTAEEHASFDRSLAEGLEPFKALDPAFFAARPDQAEALAWVMQSMHCPVTLSRSRYTEDSLERAVKQGVRQYVILGAGFDTFAFRRPDLVAQVFELDHPVTQAMKRQRIAQAGWTMPGSYHLVPVDFGKESLAAALERSPYDPHLPGFFSWLGVTYYLTRDVVFSTLRAIAGLAPRGSTVVFDYMDTDSFIPEKVGQRAQMMHDIARQVGEPMKAGFDPLGLAADLQSLGFDLQENLGPAAIESRYFQGRTDRLHAFEHVHFARAVVV